MLKSFPRGTLGAYRAYFSGPQLKKKRTKWKKRFSWAKSSTDHACMCVHTLQCWGWAEQAGRREKRKESCAPLLCWEWDRFSLRRLFSQTALETATTLPFKVAKRSQALGTWRGEGVSSHICSFTLYQMPRFLLFALYHSAERGKLTKNQSRSKKREFLLFRNKAKSDPQFLH